MFQSPVSLRSRSKGNGYVSPTEHLVTFRPAWLESLIEEIERYQYAVQECSVIHNASQGKFTAAQAHECLIQFYPFMETFPHWVSLNLEKTSDRVIQGILERYVQRTKWHAHQWVLMAEGFGMCRKKLFETPIRLKMEALNQYLWMVNRHHSIAEGLMVMGYVLGGMIRLVAPSLLKGLILYEQLMRETLTKNAFAWVKSYIQTDERFILESLEITGDLVSSVAEQEGVRTSSIRSLELLLMALEECGSDYDPCGSYRHTHCEAA